LKPRELKQILVEEGFQVFRVLGSHVVLADRVRDNLIMDSGVAVVSGALTSVRLVVKAQAADYPAETEEQLFTRARALGDDAVSRGYREIETAVVPIPDPTDAARTLDTWYEVTYEKPGLELRQLMAELRAALGLAKVA
jgi:predicted RNA binding protein YcfA (HicA-like mRNA interferase family)